jgi:hypothetical protein
LIKPPGLLFRNVNKIDDYNWKSNIPVKGETLAHGALNRAFAKILEELSATVSSPSVA